MSSDYTHKKIAYNTFFQLTGKVVSMGITVLVTIIVARYFGRNIYGEFSLMQTWPALFFIIVDFGFNAVAVREITNNWLNAGKYFTTVLVLRVIFSALLIAVLSIILVFFPYSAYLKTGIILSLFMILTQGLYATGNIIFQAKLKYDLSTYAYLAGYIVVLVLTLLSVKLNLGIIFVSLSYVAGGVATFLFMLVFILNNYRELEFKFDKSIAIQLLQQSLPLGLMFIFSQINFKSDSIFLSFLPVPTNLKLTNNDVVALYNLPYKIFEVTLVLPTFFMNSMYPVYLNKLRESPNSLLNTFKRSILILILMAVVSSIFVVVLSPWIINFLGGSQFHMSVVVLQILMTGLILYFLTQPLAWMLVTMGNQRVLPLIYLASAVFNVISNLIFIPAYSFYASAVITHLSELLILGLLYIAVVKTWRNKYA